MIAFATLLLGLVAGEIQIDLLVSAPASAVELRVDGALCARLEAPPWSAWCDLGDELAPRRLEAIAYDASGAESGRAEQRLNVDSRDADISLLIEHDLGSGDGLLRVAAASAGSAPPREVTVTVDGAAVPVRDPAAVELPALDLAQPHLVRVEAIWSDHVAAAVDAIVGGEFGDRLTTELTAVPIRVDGRRTPAPPELAGAIRRDGRALRVAAVDRGPGELWVVADPERLPEVARYVSRPRLPSSPPAWLRQGTDPRARPELGGLEWRHVGRLTAEDRLRIVWPWPERRAAAGREHELFLPSPPMSLRDGLPWLLYQARLPARGEGPPRLADAVAVAGLTLAGTERRRAVLLLLGAADADASHVAPAAVRAYLDRLRVPLHVWRLAPAAAREGDPWGESLLVGTPRRLESALRALADDLSRQRIVWLEGSHLPHEIELDPRLSAGAGPQRASAAELPAEDADGGPVLPEDDSSALAEAFERGARQRRAAVARALDGGAARVDAAGVALRAEPGLGLDLGALARALAAGAMRWSAATSLALPPLDGTEIAIVARLDDHPELARAIDGLGARGHAAYGVAVLETGGRPADEVEALALHELAHLLAERAWPRPLPVWLEEGLAELLSRSPPGPPDAPLARRGELTRRIESGGVHTLARGPVADLLDLARAAERGTLPALADWTSLSWREFVAPESRARHYALAGELVAFLLVADPPRGERMRVALARAATDGTYDLESALARAAGDATELDAALRAWLVAERDRLLASPAAAPR